MKCRCGQHINSKQLKTKINFRGLFFAMPDMLMTPTGLLCIDDDL